MLTPRQLMGLELLASHGLSHSSFASKNYKPNINFCTVSSENGPMGEEKKNSTARPASESLRSVRD